MSSRLSLLLLLIALLPLAIAAQRTPPLSSRTITVTGTAERRVPADLGVTVLAIQTQADTVASAGLQNNMLTTGVMAALRKLHIANLSMRTTGFDVIPIYQEPASGQPASAPPKIIGHQVVNRLEVRVPDADPARLASDVGHVLDSALAAGANRIDSVNFTLRDEQPVLRQVLADATHNAALTAATLAQAANVTLGPLLTLTVGPPSPSPTPPLYMRATLSPTAAVPVEPGEVTVSATVDAVYAIR